MNAEIQCLLGNKLEHLDKWHILKENNQKREEISVEHTTKQ